MLLGFWRKRVNQRRINMDTALFLTLFLQCPEVPVTHPRKTAALGEFNWQLISYKSIVCINSYVTNTQKGKSILSLERAVMFLKRSICVCHISEPAFNRKGARIQYKGKVISKIQHHLVLHCSTSHRQPHVPSSAPHSTGGPLLTFPPWCKPMCLLEWALIWFMCQVAVCCLKAA